MPKINVYLPDDLANAVRTAGIPVSSVCQSALADAVAAAGGPVADRSMPAGDGADESRFTRRARDVVDRAERAGADAGHAPTTADLVAGIVAEGNNAALSVLRTLEIEPDDLATELRGLTRGRGRQHSGELRVAVRRAYDEALRLGNNYVGCEHLLLGLAADSDDELVAATLHGMGVDLDTARRAVAAWLAGYAAARDTLTFSGLSAPIRSAFDEIRTRLGRLESSGSAS